MSSALYSVSSGGNANAQDVDQLVAALTAQNDVPFASYQPIANPGAPTVAVGSSGVLSGAYQYAVVCRTGYVDGNQTPHYSGNQTAAGTASATVNPSAQEVDLSAIPLGPTGVVARDVYRTKAGGSTFYFLVTIADNVTTDYTDNTPDSGLSTTTAPTVNSTGSPPQLPVYDAVPGFTAPQGSLAFVSVHGALVLYESDGTAWSVAGAIPATTSEAGTVAIPQAVSGTPISPVRVGDAEEQPVPNANTWTTVNPAFTPSANGFFDLALSFRVTADTTVQAQVTYANAAGAATSTLLDPTAYTYTSGGDNTYDVLCAAIRAVSGTAIAVQVQSSVASAVVASANVVGR